MPITLGLSIVASVLGLTIPLAASVDATARQLLSQSAPETATAGQLLSAIAGIFAGARKRWLDDRLVRRLSNREVPGLATPKPYDSIISLAAGVLAAIAFWAAVADQLAAAHA